MECNIGAEYPPFCKFNILSISPHAHVLKCRIDPDGLALFLLRRPVNRKPCETIPETLRYRKNVIDIVSRMFWKRELFPFCRDYWSAVTKCPRNTCLWRTSCTTWGTTLAIRSFNAGVTTTFSSFGCNGAPRYKIHCYRKAILCFFIRRQHSPRHYSQ